MLLIIDIDDQTGYPQRINTPGADRAGDTARVVYNSLYTRYKALQREIAHQQHERDAKAADALLTSDPAIRLVHDMELRQGA